MSAHDIAGLRRVSGEVVKLFMRRIGFEFAGDDVAVDLTGELEGSGTAEKVVASGKVWPMTGVRAARANTATARVATATA